MTDSNQTRWDELIALAPARQKMYAFLSAAFSQAPSTEGLEAILDDAFLGSATALFSSETLAPLRQYVTASADASELQQQAQHEFISLFKVPGAQYVPPYESVFRDTREVAGRKTKGLLMGQSAVDVRKWYHLAALEISDEYKDLPDHICLELNYLAHLCGKEQEFTSRNKTAKLKRAREMQRDFLAAHVVSWIGDLRDKIHEKSQHAYYRAIADMAVEFTRRDLLTLEDMHGASSGSSAPEYEKIDS